MITEIDPIFDSQMHLSHGSNVPTLVCGAVLERHRYLISYQRPRRQNKSLSAQHATSSNDHNPQSCSPHSIIRPRPPVLSSQSRSILCKQRYGAGFHFVAEAFDASELKTLSAGKPRRRGKIASRQDKPKAADGLTLISGLLPTPTFHCTNSSVTSGDMTATHHGRLYTSLRDTSVRTDHVPNQSEIAKTSVVDGRQVQHREADRWERAVRGQLASITAPIRHDSESSGSGTEDPSVVHDEDDDDIEGLDTTSQSNSIVGPRRSTFVDDQRYFEQAMHYLDANEDGESVENEFWSQYNAMD